MSNAIEDLQRNSLLSEFSLFDLLMNSLFIARKLKLSEFEGWVNKELEGYIESDIIPTYRKIPCQIKMQNPYYGWQHKQK